MNAYRKIWRGGAAVLLTSVLVLSGCGGKRDVSGAEGAAGSCDAGTGRVTIATGNSTGVYYVFGGGLAQVISKNTKLRATAAETGASVQNIEQLVRGDNDIAFSLADTAADAVAGTGAFEGKKQPVRALARIHTNSTHVIVRASAGIDSIADMRGKTVSTGSPKSGTEVIANRLLTAAGLDPARDVKAQRLDLSKTVDGMKDGNIDAFIWSGGLPTPAVSDLFRSLGDRVKLLDVTSQLAAMKKINPVYDRGTIGKEVYGTPADVPAIVVPNLLLVREDMPAARACALAKLLIDHKADLQKVHPAAREISRETAVKTEPVKLHDGAKQALRG